MSLISTDFNNCKHSFIWHDVCECLEGKQCKFAYSYGGDVFCKHPSASLEGKQDVEGQKIFEYAGLFERM